MLTFFQAIVIGLLQGVTELFPISSLGHTVLLPSLFGWHDLAKAQSRPESFFLAFVVALHVATALALVLYFWRDWVKIVRGFVRTLRTRKIETSDERIAWLIVVASIPAGVLGLALEHPLRTVFAKPVAAAAFLMVNAVMLGFGERYRRRAEVRRVAREHGTSGKDDSRRLDTLEFKEAGVVGVAQTGALFAGISRSGITMVAGLMRGLDHEDAARFSFLLATPIILAAGLYKIPDLLGPLGAPGGHSIRGQALAGGIAAALAALASVRFLMKYFETKTLTAFAIYCFVFGLAMVVRFGFFS